MSNDDYHKTSHGKFAARFVRNSSVYKDFVIDDYDALIA
jgi:hypothetical protein